MANTITASFGLNLNPLKAAARSAKSIGAGLGSSFTALIGPLAAIGAAVGAAFGAKKFADGVKGALDLGGALSDVAAQTGIAAGKAYELQQQLEDNGVAAEEFSGIINKMQKTLAAPTGKKAINDLGLSFAEVSKMTPDQQFVAIGKAIGKISDPTKKTAAAMSVFGKSGAGLLASFSDSAFGNADTTLSKQADILNQDAETFDAASDRLGKITRPLKGFFLGVASSIAKNLLPILDKIIATDLVGIGKIFGAAMVVAFDAFKGAFADPTTALDVLTNGLIAGFLTAGNYLIGIFEFLGKLLSDKDFWGGLINVFLGLEMIISGALMKGFNTPLKFFQDSMQFIVEKTLAGLDKLNPFSTKKDEIKEQQNLLTKYTDELNGKKGGTFRTGGQGPDVVIPDIVAATDPKRIKQLNNYIAGAKLQIETLTEGKTFAAVQASNKGQDLTIAGKTPDELIAEGRATAGKGGKNIFTAAAAAYKNTKVTDALGAGQYTDKLQAGLAKLRAQGAEMMGPAAPVAAAAAAAIDKSPFQFGQNRLSGEMMDAGKFTRGIFQGADARIRDKESRGMERFQFGFTGLEKGASSRGGKRLSGLTTKSLDGAGTGLKPLITETPATPADKAAIDTANNSKDLLAAFQDLVAAWTH